MNEAECYHKLYGNLVFCVEHYKKNWILVSVYDKFAGGWKGESNATPSK